MYEVPHVTTYEYDAPVGSSFAEVRQLPADVDGQVCVRRSVTTQPAADSQREHVDYFGNLAATVTIHEPHDELVVTSSSLIDTSGRPTSFGAAGRSYWTAYTADQADPDDFKS